MTINYYYLGELEGMCNTTLFAVTKLSDPLIINSFYKVYRGANLASYCAALS